MAPATRSSRPRRKPSSSSSTAYTGRTNSWELMERDQRQSSVDEDAMDTDEPSLLAQASAEQAMHPLLNMAERIGKEVEIFAEELDKYMEKARKAGRRSRKEVAGLVEKYKRTADDTVGRLQRNHSANLREKFRRKCNANADTHVDHGFAMHEQTTLDDLERWTAELHTWQLFQTLLELDYPEMTFKDGSRGKKNDRFTSDKGTWHDFIQSSDIAKERLKILKWLELTAEVTGSDVDIIEEELARESDKGSSLLYDGWMDTRERIKSEKRLRFWDMPLDSRLPDIQNSDGMSLLVTQLDPDAVTRQDRSLEKPDLTFERAFWTMCWEMLRRGYSMDEIREWCAEKNELARAFSIGAQPENIQTGQNFRERWLWRQACAVAAQHGLDSHERGVYGLLCGEGKAVEPICRSWSDFLFAEYNMRLLRQYESYLATHNSAGFSSRQSGPFRSPHHQQDDKDRFEAARDIVGALELDPKSRVDVANPFQRVQAALISHNVTDLLFYQGIALARKGKKDLIGELKNLDAVTLIAAEENLPDLTDDPDVLRVMTHIYLIYRELGVDFGEGPIMGAIENALCAYIEYIVFSGKIHLVPLYASKLSSESAIVVLARCLPNITNPQEQAEFVTLMTESGIDVPEVLTHQAQLAMWYSQTLVKKDGPMANVELLEPTADLKWPGFRLKVYQQQPLTSSEETLIRAMEWFLLVEGGWVRMFQALTDISIAFLKSSHINAALELFERLPFADISIKKQPTTFHQPVDILDDSDDDTDSANGVEDSGKAPALRHSASLAFRSQRHQYKTFGNPIRGLDPEKTRVHRALYKAHARTYFELGQLVEALRKLFHWRNHEQTQIDLSLTLPANDPSVLDGKQEARKRLDQLVRAMEPLLHEFLVRPSPCVDPPSILKDLRRAFLPQMVLAYTASLQCAGSLLSREHMLQCLDLATDIADNDELIADFKAGRQMGVLVDAFALASRTLLKLNEIGSASSSKTWTKRNMNGRTFAIWDVT